MGLPPGGSRSRGPALDPCPAATTSSALSPPLSLPPGRRSLVPPGFFSGGRAGNGCMTGGQAQTSSLSPLGHRSVASWDYRFGGCHCCASFYFFPQFPSKSRGVGEGKENPVQKGAVRTDLSSVEEEDPWSGRVFEPAQGREPWVRAERRGGSCASARCPPSAARPRCARPLPGCRAPSLIARDQGTPSSIFLCSFSKAPRKLVLLFHYL